MSARTCQWHSGCDQPVMGQRHCKDHYWKLRRARKLRTTLVDAAPTQAAIQRHLDSGRGLRDLAKASGVGITTLYRLRDAQPGHRVQGDVARRIQTTGPRPTDVGCIRRVEALRRLGYSLDHIAGEAGMGVWNLKRSLCQRHFTDRRARDLADAYERLSNTPGPSRVLARRAAAQGLASAMAWDGIDIDDPASVPDAGVERERGIDDTVAEYRHLTRLGVSPEKAAKQLGVEPATIERAVQRLAVRKGRSEQLCAWERCHRPFTPLRDDQRYHSTACRRAAYRAAEGTRTAASTPPGKEAVA